MIGPSLYDVLGAEPSASVDALHRAYRERARAMHPDHGGGGAGCTAGMAAVNAAWETLRDPARRRAYDESHREPIPELIAEQLWEPSPPQPLLVTTRDIWLLRGLIVAVVILWSVVMAVFTVITFAQSG